MKSNDAPEDETPGMDGEQHGSSVLRRSFLGAAATLTALPQVASAELAEPMNVVVDRTVTDDETYTMTDCGAVDSRLTNVRIEGQMNDGPVSVSGIHETDGTDVVDIECSSGSVNVGTGLDSDRALDLANRLRVAADAAEGKFDA